MYCHLAGFVQPPLVEGLTFTEGHLEETDAVIGLWGRYSRSMSLRKMLENGKTQTLTLNLKPYNSITNTLCGNGGMSFKPLLDYDCHSCSIASVCKGALVTVGAIWSGLLQAE